MAVVLHHSRAKGTAKLVLLGIANHMGDGGAWPSVETLGAYANVDRRNIQRALDKLVQLGELSTNPQAGGSADLPDYRRPNQYHVLIHCPPWCDRTPWHRDLRGRGALFPQPVDNPVNGAANTPRGGGDSAARTPGASAARNITKKQPSTGSSSTTDRAREAAAPPCAVCGQSPTRCQAVQTKWAREDRHDYKPQARP